MKRAMCIGAYGQDGSFMSELLESKGYEVIKIGRNDILPEEHSIGELIKKSSVDEIYNFAGITDTFNPYYNISNIIDLNVNLPSQILEEIQGTKIKFFNSSSSLTRSGRTAMRINEEDEYSPLYPYGASKVCAEMMIKMFRKKGVFACSGIFFPHESERRRKGFFTRTVVDGVVAISQGKSDSLEIGNLNFSRDWGYAKEYMEAVFLMMQQDVPKDYVIGTGDTTTGWIFVKKCFEYLNLDYKKYVQQEEREMSFDDYSCWADTTDIKIVLGWKAKATVYDIIKKMIDDKRTV